MRGRIKARRIDFLICKAEPPFTPLHVIELDGSSHNKPERKKADDFLNRALTATGYPITRVRVGEDFEKAIDEILKTL